MKFTALKSAASSSPPEDMTAKERQAWRAMNYLYALHKFGHVTASQCMDELSEIEYDFYRSLDGREKVLQEAQEGGNPLSVAWHLLNLQPQCAEFEKAKDVLENLIKEGLGGYDTG